MPLSRLTAGRPVEPATPADLYDPVAAPGLTRRVTARHHALRCERWAEDVRVEGRWEAEVLWHLREPGRAAMLAKHLPALHDAWVSGVAAGPVRFG